MKIYAAYGSNMNISQMKMRCPKAKILGTGIMEEYRLTFRGSGRGVANIEKHNGGRVPVLLWNITEDCEIALDIYEGYPRLYDKCEVEVSKMSGEIIKAFVYVMDEKYTDMPAQPTKYYRDIIWQGYIDNNFPTETLRIALSENLLEIDKKLNERYRY
ncbi:MAG: gamma-glutamylcyclotransferase [Clostridiaceae bacterium]|jgi:hypothetical protein|nr:gamma-glutamylcyclotransferase [Clostridiaceae bacterium]